VDIMEQTDRTLDARRGDRAGIVVRAAIDGSPLDVSEHEALVRVPEAGAVVSFGGIVRDHDGGRPVRSLEYSAYPAAATILAQIADGVIRKADVRRVAVSHRVGRLEVGEVALACAVSADHRHSAFAVCAALVEEVKARLPVWKLQVFEDGSQEWVGAPTITAGCRPHQ
jgi:molybdopterin synthase catalytic subunit